MVPRKCSAYNGSLARVCACVRVRVCVRDPVGASGCNGVHVHMYIICARVCISMCVRSSVCASVYVYVCVCVCT